MDYIKYTKKDMHILHGLSKEGTIVRDQLEELEYDPVKFRKVLESYGLKKEIYFLFELPFEEVALYIHKGEVSGYLDFRLRIRK